MLNLLRDLEHKHNLANGDADKLQVSAGEPAPLPGHRRAGGGAVTLTLVYLVTQTTAILPAPRF